MRRVQRQPERIVERRLGHLEIRGPIDALLRHRGQVHADGEHIDIGGHAGGADRFGALQVGFGRANGLLRGFQVLRRQDGAIIGARRSGDDIHLYQSLFFAGHLLRQFGRLHRIPGLAGIIYRLIHRDLGLKVVEKIRPVQGADGEVLNTELVLGEQRTEDEDRVVAAREGLGVVDFGEHPSAGLRDSGLGSPRSRGGAGNRLVLSHGEADGFAERQWILRPKGNGE